MSRVTNTLLNIDTYDTDEREQLSKINLFFEKDDVKGFVSIEDDSLPNGWYGGTKGLETELYVGAFNHLDLDDLVEHIKQIDWPGPSWVQLIYKGQDETKFSIIDVIEHE